MSRTSRGQGDGHVGEEAHGEAAQGRDGGGGGDEVATDDIEAEVVLDVVVAQRVDGVVADAGAAGVGEDGGIDLEE